MTSLDQARALIRDVPDFPQPGILFKDLTPMLGEPLAFRAVIDALVSRVRDRGFQRIVAIESRGFLFGAALADRLGLWLAPVRKLGKLPYKTDGFLTRRPPVRVRLGAPLFSAHARNSRRMRTRRSSCTVPSRFSPASAGPRSWLLPRIASTRRTQRWGPSRDDANRPPDRACNASGRRRRRRRQVELDVELGRDRIVRQDDEQ